MPLTTNYSNGKTAVDPARISGGAPGGQQVRRPAGGEDASRRRARSVAKQQQSAERIAAATAQIAAQTAEANQASRQLRDLMHRVAVGAEESSGATQQSLAAVGQVEDQIKHELGAAATVERLSISLGGLLEQTSKEISDLLSNVAAASVRQDASVEAIGQLERQAEEIGDIVKTVGDIADQTNLLALNAAIEAARARQHGKGFAVVADEVRTLAETSERSANQIRELIDEVRGGVNKVAAAVQQSSASIRAEVERGGEISTQLATITREMEEMKEGSVTTSASAGRSAQTAGKARILTEEIASSSEQQAAASQQLLQTVEQQSHALAESEQAASSLSEVAEDLRSSTDVAKSAEEVAAASEQLAATVEEINRAAKQVSIAIDQIADGARNAAEKAAEATEAVGTILAGAGRSMERAGGAVAKADGLATRWAATKDATDSMIEAVAVAAASAGENVKQIMELEQVSLRIDKIVNAITNVAIQTNMLAVNGSVESARAGEFGKGFAVVSTDIRNLARDSAENAEQIKDLVKAVQDKISEVRRDLADTGRQAVAEVEAARQTALRLVEVAGGIDQLKAENVEVRKSTEEIAASLKEVNEGLAQVTAAAREAGDAATQSAQAAQQQAHGAEELAAAVEEIAALADELQNG